MLSSSYELGSNKKSRYIKVQEAKGLPSVIGKIPLIGPLLL